MKIEYDKEADALYIAIAEANAARTHELGGGINLDYDADDRLIGIEVISASKRYSQRDLATVIAQNLLAADSDSAA